MLNKKFIFWIKIANKHLKTFVIVLFIEEGAIEIIPSNWIINESETFWPNISSAAVIAKYIKERHNPADDWDRVKIKIYADSNSFKSAKLKAKIAEDTSNIGSDSSEEESNFARKRKKPVRYETEDSLSESESLLNSVKKYKIPKLPKAVENKVSSVDAVLYQSRCSSLSNEDAVTKKQVVGTSSDLHSETENTVKNYSPLMSKRIFEYLELMHGEIRRLHEKCDKINLQLESLTGTNGNLFSLNENLPTGIDLPVNTEERLKDLNDKIKSDSEFSAKLVRYLHGFGSGKTPRSFLLSIMKKIFIPELAIKYSRFGRKGKKSFSEYRELLNVMLAAVSLKYQEKSCEELGEMFSKNLAAAADWNRRKIRQSDIATEFETDAFNGSINTS